MTGNGSTSEPVGRAVGLGNVFRHCFVTVHLLPLTRFLESRQGNATAVRFTVEMYKKGVALMLDKSPGI